MGKSDLGRPPVAGLLSPPSWEEHLVPCGQRRTLGPFASWFLLVSLGRVCPGQEAAAGRGAPLALLVWLSS